MHVGHFTYFYTPVVNGVVLTIRDWNMQAQQAGIPTTVFTPRVPQAPSDSGVVSYPSFLLNQKLVLTVPFFPSRIIEQEIRKRAISILHVHHPFIVGDLAVREKQRLHLPIVFTYHTRYGDYAKSYLPFLPAPIAERVITDSVIRFANRCDAITVANTSLRQELLAQGVKTPMSIVPPGVDTKVFGQGNRQSMRKRLKLTKQDTVFLYVGRLAKEKNIDFLLRAFTIIHERFPDTQLLLVGKGTKESYIGSGVRVINDVAPEDIVDVYAAGDLFVYASQTETFGRVVVEAMAAGLPIVTLDGVSIADLIKDRKTGRKVASLSERAFADAVSDLINHPQKARALGLRAKREAAEFDNRVSWVKLLGVYRSLDPYG